MMNKAQDFPSAQAALSAGTSNDNSISAVSENTDVELAEEFKRFKQEYPYCDKMLARNHAFLFDFRYIATVFTCR